MIILDILLFTLVFAKDIGTSHSLVQDGKNVCSKRSLVKVVDIYPTTWAEDWHCETSYPATTCERIRSNEIDINSVYFIKEDLICCPGWLLSENDGECNQPCPDGYFGENCMYECRCLHGRNPNQCNVEDGSCDCLAGWTGRECDQRCSPGFFGPNCSERSIFTCMNGGINHPDTGLCLCMSQYGGSRCEIQCEVTELLDCGVFNCDNCIQNRTSFCDHITESCFCRDDWKGRYCSDPCNIGTRGQSCAESCCSGRGFCTGEGCVCLDGYHGDECQYKCEKGRFGRSCREKCECPSCNHVTGNCDLCPIGFTGGRCTERCMPSKWGQSCNLTCSCEACDVFTGECPSTGSLLWLLAVVLVVIILLLVVVGSIYFICNRSSKKVQSEDDQMAAQNDNYSTIQGTSSWSGGDYQGLRDIYTPNGQPDKTENQIYNPVYQSAKVDTDTDMGEGAYNSVSTKDRPNVQKPMKTRFNNPVYNTEVLTTKPTKLTQKPKEFEEDHPYEDLGHDYDNAIFTQKP